MPVKLVSVPDAIPVKPRGTDGTTVTSVAGSVRSNAGARYNAACVGLAHTGTIGGPALLCNLTTPSAFVDWVGIRATAGLLRIRLVHWPSTIVSENYNRVLAKNGVGTNSVAFLAVCFLYAKDPNPRKNQDCPQFATSSDQKCHF